MLADWNWDGAEKSLKKAVSLSPGYATAHHWYGYLDMLQGEFDKALTRVKKALDLDPISPVINRVIGDVYFNARRYDEAIPALKKTLELESCVTFGHTILANCYREKAMYQEALDELDREKECRNDSVRVNYAFGLVYAKMGQTEKARLILEKLKARNAKGMGVAELYFALRD